jgi:hypothetical protein
MTSLTALWLPILLSSVIVFVASSIIHMLLPWHKSDYPKVPNEDKVRDALRPFAIPPGDYMLHRRDSTAEMKTPEFAAKLNEGPVMVITVLPNGPWSMAKPCPLVHLLPRRRLIRGVCRLTRIGSRGLLSARVPARRRHRVHRLCASALADVDLVSPRVEHDDQGDRRRIDLRNADRRHVRLAVAALKQRGCTHVQEYQAPL